MAVNDLTFNQLATVLAGITSQATGQSEIAPVNYSQFVSMAQTALKTGYDPLTTAISQVLGKTIFSVRPYTAKFRSLRVSNQQFGNHERKLTAIDKGFDDDNRFKLTEGESIDQQIVRKPAVLQTNYYGANVVEKVVTIYKDQLDCAFTSPEEFGRFISMILQNVSDMLEQATENTARATLANLIIATVKHGATEQSVHLFTEWKTARGLTGETAPTNWSVLSPAQFDDFIKWSYARISTVANMMTERGTLYHQNVTGKEVMRHTPFANMKAFFASSINNQIRTEVLSAVFNTDQMQLVESEAVNYWQASKDPLTIKGKSVFLKTTDGAISSDTTDQTIGNVFGIIMDEEAAGITHVNEWTASAPFNARGGYTNTFWHRTDRFWNDQTENAVVFLLD